jgi:hypothetical protein
VCSSQYRGGENLVDGSNCVADPDMRFSKFRTCAASCAAKTAEAALTAWVYERLRVVAIPVTDADTLDDLETVVLNEFDPPLNLMKMPKTPVRRRLSELRRQYGGAG